MKAKGIVKNKCKKNPYRVEISVNGKMVRLGNFKTHKDAIVARLAGEKKYIPQRNKLRSDNTSGYVGVSFNKARGMWLAYYYENKAKHLLKYSYDKEEAITARKDWEKSK